jgi:hypothetical protein
VELSGLIFVALAVAWAAYLIPKALQHHDEVVRSRSVDRFSHRMRVLARREPVNGRNARLVVTPARAAAPPVVTTKGPAIADARARREVGARATRRRRRVLGLLLLANAVVIGVAAFHLISWWWTAAAAILLVGWLVACRLMVRSERGIRRSRPVTAPAEVAPVSEPDAEGDSPLEDTMASPLAAPLVVGADLVGHADPEMWDPVPVTLPTYVSKPAARRTVRTIDLDETGVWSSGRSEADSALAREADEAERAQRSSQRGAPRREGGEGRRVVGS